MAERASACGIRLNGAAPESNRTSRGLHVPLVLKIRQTCSTMRRTARVGHAEGQSARMTLRIEARRVRRSQSAGPAPW
jgi:hypothetical protein